MSSTKRQMEVTEPIFKFHPWNANGIDEITIRTMRPTWEGADLNFVENNVSHY